MRNLLEKLEWDSTFFGYPVAKVTTEAITEEMLTKIINLAKFNGTKLLYLFTDPADAVSSKTAKTCNAKLVDQKVTFHIKISEAIVPVIDNHIEEYVSDQPSARLINLAIQSGLYSRFKTDPGFKNNEFEKLYHTWIENSVNKKIADCTFIYKENGLELGFVTVKIKDLNGQIGLIAVDENSRGKSIGKKLVAAVFDLLSRNNIPDLEVATQVDNSGACNFYQKTGFRVLKSENIYHIWL
jgi:dTDP-4-amino-4,6-dideoxy-D-galactose acyltransferase